MAKRRRKADQWAGEVREQNLNGMFAAIRDKAQADMGGPISIGVEAQSSLVGLPLPSLSLRYLFQSSMFPLSRIVQIIGQEGSAKSAFLYEMFRWHMFYGGGAVLAENENKDSPELRHSLLQWRAEWINRLMIKKTLSLEEWQDVFTYFSKTMCEQMDAADGPGRTFPFAIAVDSLMATAPQSEIEQVEKDGHAVRGYALAANMIARYMRTMPQRIRDYPLTIIGTNHEKPGTDARGLPTSSIPGGKAVKFMETYEIGMKKASTGADIDKADYQGLRVDLKARKNSLGPSRKIITAELQWWFAEDADGQWRQHTAWDWHSASTELLLKLENTPGKKTLYNNIRDLLGLKPQRSKRACAATQLGLDEAVSYRDLGAVLEQHPDKLTQLYRMLGITERYPFQPGVDYMAAREAAAAHSHLIEGVEGAAADAAAEAEEEGATA